MNYLFVGDTHGDLRFVESVAAIASDYNCEIIQVGDWGFLWPRRDQLKQLSDILVEFGVVMRFIDGNHDDHPRLRTWKSNEWQPAGTEHVIMAPNVIYQPRGSVHEDKDGVRFLFMGGAPSIDKAHRTPGRSWWPEEVITEAEMERATKAENIRVLVTHDSPTFPPGFTPKGDPDFRVQALESQNNIATLIEHYKPELHVHGHWHFRYKAGITIGLDCNNARLNDAYYFWHSP